MATTGNDVSMTIKTTTIELAYNEELRIGVGFGQVVHVWLIKGTAEVFGVELKQSKPDVGKRKNKKLNKHKLKDSSANNEKSTELSLGEMNIKSGYEFRNCHVSIYTCNDEGCKVMISGETQYSYVSKETPMMIYINYNCSLTNMRRWAQMALIEKDIEANTKEQMLEDSNISSHSVVDAIMENESDTFGPRVMVVGPPNTGKATLCRILANYGVRSGFSSILVDLDCNLNLITIPGAIAAVGMTESTNMEAGLNLNWNSNGLASKDGMAAAHANQCKPIVYYYGHLDPGSKSEVYRTCVSTLALAVKERLVQCNAYRCGGVIIKCHSWLCSAPNVLSEVIEAFKVNVIIVVDDEYLYNHLKNNYKEKDIAVEKVSKSGGVKQKDETERQVLRQRIIRNYFYGASNDFEPSSVSFDAKSAKIYQIGKDKTESSLLPMDEKSAVQKFSLLPVRMDASLRGQMLAVLHEDLDQNKSENDTVEMSNVMGFVHVTDVSASQISYGGSLASQMQSPFEITLLSPNMDSELHKKCFLKGNIVWTDR